MNPLEKNEGAIPSPESAPRRRVLDLVLRMARVTALGGAAVGLSACESCGPVVCDPLPPPITCANPTRAELQRAMYLEAQWVAVEGGGLEVLLEVEYQGRQPVAFASMVTVVGATQKKLVVTPTSVALNFAPAAGISTVTVGLTFDCSGTTDAMTLSLDVSGTPSAGSRVTVTITSP